MFFLRQIARAALISIAVSFPCNKVKARCVFKTETFTLPESEEFVSHPSPGVCYRHIGEDALMVADETIHTYDIGA